MKQTTDGKRFSKRARTELEPCELRQYCEERGRPNGKGGFMLGGWRHEVAGSVKAATAYLESKGLPTTFKVFRSRSSEKWQAEPPDPDDFKAMRTLDIHIQALGFPRDSMEDLAARIITLSARLESASGDHAIEAALRYSEARTLARVYGLESATNKENSGKPRKRQWAVDLAEKLAATYDNFPEAWAALKEEDDSNIFISGEFLKFSSFADGDDQIRKESFRTGYFTEAKKNRPLL
jgi:hypothetical protein